MTGSGEDHERALTSGGLLRHKFPMKVVILSYNHPEITARAIASALEYYSSCDLILVHNGSEEKHQKQLMARFPEVDHLVLSQNRGFSGGANEGLKRAFADSPWVFFMTNDCQVLSPPEIPEQPCLLAPLIYFRKPGRIDSIGGALDKTTVRLRHLQKDSFSELTDVELPYVPGSAFLVHRDLFFATQGFDELFGTYWEDVDWCLRLGNHGFQLRTDNRFRLAHGVGKTCRKNPFYTFYLYNRNRRRLAEKHKNLISKSSWFWHFEQTKASLKLLRQGRIRDFKDYSLNLWKGV
jgi:GT2 family glycosyltransferase